MRTRHWLWFVLGALLLMPALGGCASGGPGSPLAGAPTSSAGSPEGNAEPSTSPATDPAQPTPRPSRTEENPGDMTDPKPVGTSRTLRGSLQDGVEANCTLLNADDGQLYLLVGGDRQVLAAGGRVEAVGQVVPDLMTTCQQGIPFTVTTLRKI